MTPKEKKRRVQEYVRQRLRDECAREGRGHKAELARKLGIATAHVSNMLDDPPTRNPGEDVRRSVAEYWGITTEELERLALGGEPKPAPEPTNLTIDALREALREELRAERNRDRDDEGGGSAGPASPPDENKGGSKSGNG